MCSSDLGVRQDGRLMAALVILGLIVAVCSYFAIRQSPAILTQSLRASWRRFIELAPRMAVAMLLAGFVGKLIPAALVGGAIGPESGFLGIMIATLVGGFIPSGPILAFPIVVVLLNSGAGLPQVVAFITAWSLLAWHRLIIYEAPIMGWRFSWQRIVSSLILPPIAGVLTIGVMKIWFG